METEAVSAMVPSRDVAALRLPQSLTEGADKQHASRPPVSAGSSRPRSAPSAPHKGRRFRETGPQGLSAHRQGRASGCSSPVPPHRPRRAQRPQRPQPHGQPGWPCYVRLCAVTQQGDKKINKKILQRRITVQHKKGKKTPHPIYQEN